MKRVIFQTILILLGYLSLNQTIAQSLNEKAELDEAYREDQFYFSFTYNYLGNKPDEVQQRGFPAGFHFGFIRDMPINTRRNLAVGLGLGLSSNSYNQNILINNATGDNNFQLIDGNNITFSNNKFTTYLLEMPFELRWRTSTAESYKFWRVYTGFKVGYVFLNSSKYKGNLGTIKNNSIENFNNLQYGLTLSLGYSTFNFHLYYGLNSIFSNTLLNSQPVDMYSLKIGLITYIL